MHVLYLTNNPNLGSTSRILQNWLRLSQGTDYQAAIVVQEDGDFAKWLKAEKVPLLIDPMPWPKKSWPFPALWHAFRVARWARRHRVEVIHCNEHVVYPFALLLRRLLRLPVVCHVRFKMEESFGQWAFAKHAPEALLWTSRQQKQDSLRAVAGLVPEERQHLVSLGVDLATFGTQVAGRERTRNAWKILPHEIAVGTASALRPIKRIEDFVTLVGQLAQKDQRIVGVLAGDAVPGGEAYRDTILKQIQELKLGRRFVWTGHMEPIEPFYHAIDVFVSTSEYESFGNSVCEAMACMRPIAAYQGGSVAEVVGTAGVIVPNGDRDGLRLAIERYVENATLRTEMGVRGRVRVRDEFNPENSFRQVLQIHEQIKPGSKGAAT